MDLSSDLFYKDENHCANRNVLRISIKIRCSVVSLSCLSYKAIMCCLICKNIFHSFYMYISPNP